MEQQKTVVARQAGVTLIELMVTLVIITILSAVAVPAYNDYVKGGRIPQATNNLSNMRVKLEQFFQDNRAYTGACVAASSAPLPANDDFTYSCTLAANTFTVTALGSGIMSGFTYTIDESNNKKTTAVPTGWGTVPSGGYTCWVRKKGGAC